MHRLYENEDIVVFWNSDRCFHAKRCVGGCPEVFKPGGKPWINLGNAETKEIWQAISQCPSGALTCSYRHDIDVILDLDNCRSIATDNGKEIGECDFEVTGSGWNIYRTGVALQYRGKGIAKRLVYKVIEQGERKCVSIIATCSYARKVLNK